MLSRYNQRLVDRAKTQVEGVNKVTSDALAEALVSAGVIEKKFVPVETPIHNTRMSPTRMFVPAQGMTAKFTSLPGKMDFPKINTASMPANKEDEFFAKVLAGVAAGSIVYFLFFRKKRRRK